MDKLRAIQWFVDLADLGSFTEVAAARRASKSMVSKEISQLEADLGARLLHRSTRKVALTAVGEGYLQHCRELLLKLSDAESFVQDAQGSLKGRLRISAPMSLGLTDLSRAFADFMALYVDVHLDIHFGDEPTDLVEQGFDLCFRAASRPFDTSYIGKPIATFGMQVCASPRYLKNAKSIEKSEDLKHHNCFIYTYFRGKDVWPIGESVQVSGTLRINNTPAMLEFVKAGLGLGLFPEFVVRRVLAEGAVVEVLPNEPKPQLTVYALYPARHHVPPKLTRLIEFLEEWFARK